MKKSGLGLAAGIFLVSLVSSTLFGEVKYAKYYDKKAYELSDDNIFSKMPADVGNKLRKKIGGSRILKDLRKIPQDQYYEMVSNVEKYDERDIVRVLAPLYSDFVASRMALFKEDLDLDGEPELFVQYDGREEQEGVDLEYHYLNVWMLKWVNSTYEATYLGPFLFGSIFHVLKFGAFPEKSIFIQHQSCFECHPFVYLSAFRFDPKKRDFEPFLFDYSAGQSGGDIKIEYSLPGMGHSIDANVETRIPFLNKKGSPSLFQYFDVLDCEGDGGGPDEWWTFICDDYKCKSVKEKDLSISARKQWESAKSLGVQKAECH